MSFSLFAPRAYKQSQRLGLVLIFVAIVSISSVAIAETLPYPVGSGSGFFTYDGSSLSLDIGTTLGFAMYSDYEYAFSYDDDPIIDSQITMTGVTQIGSTYSFTNGTFSVSNGSDVFLTANIIGVLLVPTSVDTAMINNNLSAINLTNVVVSQPSGGYSRFVEDWMTATGGSGLGAVGLSLVNTDNGSLEPLLAAPASGNVTLTLQPALPEPASLLFLIVAGIGFAFRPYRRII